MNPVLFAMPGNETLETQLQMELQCDAGKLEIRCFPDQETCPRYLTSPTGRDVILVCGLDCPDGKILSFYLAACVARELGARSVGLVIPYLPYMRQDKRFRDGEGITSKHFARLLSSCCDWLVTVDPHLHRHRAMSEIYTVPTRLAHAAPYLARWIAENVKDPIIFGPDAESEQWVAKVADVIDCPYAVLTKIRHGDNDVEVSIPDASFWVGMTPVLVDDIVSTARTLIAAAVQIERAGMCAPVCVVVHPLFTGDAYIALRTRGIERIVSCNTVAHTTNKINLSRPIAEAVSEMLATLEAKPLLA